MTGISYFPLSTLQNIVSNTLLAQKNDIAAKRLGFTYPKEGLSPEPLSQVVVGFIVVVVRRKGNEDQLRHDIRSLGPLIETSDREMGHDIRSGFQKVQIGLDRDASVWRPVKQGGVLLHDIETL